jgi:hypothetical protein
MLRKIALAMPVALVALVFGVQSPGVPVEDTKPFDLAADKVNPSPATLELLRGKVLAVSIRGRGQNTNQQEPNHPIFVGKLYSLATGELVGDFIEDVQCLTSRGLPCNVVEAITTMNLPEGQVVSRAYISVDPDPQRPGHILAGGRPDGPSIISTSGIYAGRTGKADLSGLNDLSHMPEYVNFDDWVLVQFD